MASTAAISPISMWPSTITTPPTARKTATYAEDIYTRKLRRRRLIEVRSIEQFYDPVKSMFLPTASSRASARSAACG
jgi:methionyl-tRNA synthetase